MSKTATSETKLNMTLDGPVKLTPLHQLLFNKTCKLLSHINAFRHLLMNTSHEQCNEDFRCCTDSTIR